MESPGGSSRPLPAGKLPNELLERLLDQLPPAPPEVRLGARIGEDACALELPAGLLVAAADPITLTSSDAGALAVVVNANDVAVTGARPRWFLSVVLLPPGTTEGAVEELFRSIRDALEQIGAHLVGGHTEVTSAVTRPVVVGQMLGVAESRLVATGGCRAGDAVVQVRPAPIEGAAVLARAAGGATIPPELLEEALAALDRPGVSVVEPALIATELGATALHDPTEGGLAGGLHEVARADGHGIVVDREAVLWFEPGIAVCRAFGADPWCTLASGTLLATFPVSAAERARRELIGAGHEAALIGSVVDGEGVTDRSGAPIPWPDRDEVARLLSGEEEAEGLATI